MYKYQLRIRICGKSRLKCILTVHLDIMSSTKFQLVQQRLAGLTFAQVTYTKARYNEEKQAGCENSTFFFGFAQTDPGSLHFPNSAIHFDSNRKPDYEMRDYCGLEIATNQNYNNPPEKDVWIVGSVIKKADRPHFHTWAICTPQEKVFADYLNSGKKQFSKEELRKLRYNRHHTDVLRSNHLMNLALLILAHDFEYFLKQRPSDPELVDMQVFSICDAFSLELWDEYREKVLYGNRSERIYTNFIPEPAPVPITERRYQNQVAVGINTPFVKLGS